MNLDAEYAFDDDDQEIFRRLVADITAGIVPSIDDARQAADDLKSRAAIRTIIMQLPNAVDQLFAQALKTIVAWCPARAKIRYPAQAAVIFANCNIVLYAVAKRRSGERPSKPASRRSRATTPRRAASSCCEVLWICDFCPLPFRF